MAVGLTLIWGCGAHRQPVRRVALLPLRGGLEAHAAVAARLLAPRVQAVSDAPCVLGLTDLRAGLSLDDLSTVQSAVHALERLDMDEGLLFSVRSGDNGQPSLTAWRWRPGMPLDSLRVPFQGRPWAALVRAFPGLPVDSSVGESDWPEKSNALQPWGEGLWATAQGDPVGAEALLRSAVHHLQTDDRLRLDWCAALLDLGLEQRRTGSDPLPTWLEAETALQAPVDSTLEGKRQQLLGWCWLVQDRWNWAETALRQAHDRLGDRPDLLFDLSRLHPSRWPMTGFKNRNALLEYILTLNPVHVQAALALGEWLTGQGGSAKALAVYDNFLLHAPNNLDVLMAIGRIHVMENRPVQVIRTYSRVIELAPDFSEAYYNLGIAYYHTDRFDEARGFFKKCLTLDGEADSHYYLAVMAEAQGDTAQAVAEYRSRLAVRKGGNDEYAEAARERLARLLETAR